MIIGRRLNNITSAMEDFVDSWGWHGRFLAFFGITIKHTPRICV
jgi:hypothetical protein